MIKEGRLDYAELKRSWWNHRDFYRIQEETKTYDFSPWAIIKTDFRTHITIEALEDVQNRFNTGKKTFKYHAHRLCRWIGAFDYPKPKKYGDIIVFESQHNKTWKYEKVNA